MSRCQFVLIFDVDYVCVKIEHESEQKEGIKPLSQAIIAMHNVLRQRVVEKVTMRCGISQSEIRISETRC